MIDKLYLTRPLVVQMIDEYKAAKSERLKAVIEERLWAQVSTPMRRNFLGKRVFLKELLSGPNISDYKIRGYLLRAPDILWDRVEADMTLHTAELIYLEAKKMLGVSVEEAVKIVLEKYDALPNVVRLPNGKFFRKSKQASRVLRTGSHATGRSPKDWMKVRAAMSEMIRSRLGNMANTFEADRFILDVEREVEAIIRGFSQRLRRLKDGMKAGEVIGRRKVLAWCTTLVMDPPKPGEPCDLVIARKQKRKFCRTYHPDSKGDDSMREAYERVIAAYTGLVDYNHQIEGSTTDGNRPGETDA